MRLRLAAFACLLSFAGSVAACAQIQELIDPDPKETPTPGGDDDDDDGGGPTPTNSPAPTPVSSTDGDVTTLDWGVIDLDAGTSPIFRFTAPANTIGIDFLAVGSPADEGKIFGFFAIEAPDARVVIDNSGDGPARQAFSYDAMSFAVPSDDSPATASEAGPWEFSVFASSEVELVASDPRVMVKYRTAPSSTVPGGEVDLNVFFVQNAGAQASDCDNPSSGIMQGLGYAMGLYEDGPSGLSFGVVDCYDVPSSAAFADIGSDAELSELFELSAAAAEHRANLFVIDTFSGSDFGSAAGISGSVPVPMRLNGTRRSGVAVMYSANMTILGETIAHELAHSLGLYHTTEFNPAQNGFDPISDTPECAALGGSFDAGDNCPDEVNVMFPSLTGTMTGFTAGQLTVLKPTPQVRRDTLPAFAPSFSPVTTTAIPRVERGTAAWEGPPRECRGGVVRPVY